ncbi:unnamed protein product [Cyclocybe aegerita]|uniref:Zn(2)-C6 fungal-type domain-containing protein n=1 Tax=Cyclocybe aegerita TaxID=1973307 RepID=A0A8S0WST5_CYCAE|nr:unnamed protein product [Cyclocybe aegerita]
MWLPGGRGVIWRIRPKNPKLIVIVAGAGLVALAFCPPPLVGCLCAARAPLPAALRPAPHAARSTAPLAGNSTARLITAPNRLKTGLGPPSSSPHGSTARLGSRIKNTRPKQPVVRGARACTVCRAAKMKCVGAEDGQRQCQRCKRANVEYVLFFFPFNQPSPHPAPSCIFEKHRRGRKPGSKLSEASKMLRRLEKGLNSAKIKSQSTEATSPYSDELRPTSIPETSYSVGSSAEASYPPPNPHFSSADIQPQPLPSYQEDSASHNLDMEDDDDDLDRTDEAFYPAKLIKRENQRNSFFRTILNPEETPTAAPRRSSSLTPPQHVSPAPTGLSDPITAGIITEDDAKMLFDAIFLRLNPFVNLLDPALHTVSYVRSKCPFLFTTLVMAGCKFFKAEKFKQCQKLANEFAVRAFAECWKRVEVVQAFACMTYWKEPDDSRTWTFIGYACRMAVELGLNRYVANPSPTETDFQRLERRNRERTYLVLFVHDRSLSMQTGRHWMLPEDELVRNAMTWHEAGGGVVRPEDVVIAAFVVLRRIAAETTDIFYSTKGSLANSNSDINYEVVLSNCNARLTQWDNTWRHEMEKAGGEKFHFSFLSFFRLYVRLFLNSFGIQASLLPGSRQPPSLQALTMCCTSALDSLRIISQDFHDMHRYGQDSITVMTAYSAVFLLRLLRGPTTGNQLGPNAAHEIHTLISQTADSYHEASSSSHSPVSISASYHARFLRALVANDIFKARRHERERNDNSMPIDPRLQGPPQTHGTIQTSPTSQVYSPQVHRVVEQPPQTFQFPASPHLPAHPHATPHAQEYQMEVQARHTMGNGQTNAPVHYPNGYVPSTPQHASELDAHYWKNMFLELGFGEGVDPNTMPSVIPNNNSTNMNRAMPQQQQQYMDVPQHHTTHPHQQQHHPHHQQPMHSHPHQGMPPQGQIHYQNMHPAYGH